LVWVNMPLFWHCKYIEHAKIWNAGCLPIRWFKVF
jgi:hypothetical protein